eukprot:2797856-Amphidinium_carterae.2
MKRCKGEDEPIPIEEKCELCYKTWRGAFSWLEWDDLVKEVSSSTNTPVSNAWPAARQMFKNDQKALEGPSVMKVQGYQLEVSKLFTIVSEKDLRTQAGMNRLSKQFVKGLPTVELPAQDGAQSGTETHFIFSHPQGQHKKLRVKLLLQCDLNSTPLQANSQYWPLQAESLFQHTVQEQAATTGVSGLLAKEAQAPLVPLSAWLDEKWKHTMGTSGEDAAEGDPTDLGDDEEEGELLGMAASSCVSTLPAKQHNMKRGASSSFTTPPSAKASRLSQDAANAFEAKSVLSDAAFDENSSQPWGCAILDVTSQMVWCLTSEPKSPSDEELLEKWSKKLQATQILAKTVDGRSIIGLEKLVERLADRADKRMIYSALRNLLKVVLLARRISKTKIVQMDSGELSSAMGVFHEQGVELPHNICRDLVEKHTQDILSKHDYAKLLDIMNPFMPLEAFDYLNPKVVLEKLLVDWIQKGSDGGKQVQGLADLALERFAEVDLVDLDTTPAKEYTDQQHIWRGCKALLTDDFGVASQDSESVLRIKSAMTRSSKSSLTLIATTIDATPWWHELVHNYLVELPGIQEWMPRLEEDMEKLKNIDQSLEKLAVLQEVVDQLKVYTASLKPKRISNLFDKTIQAVDTVCVQALNASSKDSSALERSKACHSMVQELTTLRPHDDSLQAMKLALDENVKMLCNVSDILKLGQCAAQFNELQNTSSDDGTGQEKQLQAIITDMHKWLSSIASDVGGVPKDLIPVLQTAWVNLANLIAKTFFVVEPNWEIKLLEHGIFILGKLLTVCDLGKDEFKVVFDALELVVAVHLRLNDMEPSQDTALESMVQSPNAGSQVKALKRALLKFGEVKKQVQSKLPEETSLAEAWTQCLQRVDHADYIATAVGSHLEQRSKTEMEAAIAALDKIKGGREDGTWSDAVGKSATWKVMKDAFKANKLFNVTPVVLLDAINTVQQAHLP